MVFVSIRLKKKKRNLSTNESSLKSIYKLYSTS